MRAFVFPGQGSQKVGMGKFLFDNFKSAQSVFAEASEALSLDMQKLCFESTEAELSMTENTQPALLTVSVATVNVVQEMTGLKPDYTAGHSIGEYASFVLGGTLKFSDAIRAVRLRGQAMQSAVPAGEGGMTAVLGLNEEQVRFLCDWACTNSGTSPLSAANYNCDGQIVISGNLKTLNWLRDNFKAEIIPGEAKRAKLIPLQVSAPFHCDLMKPAQVKMESFFKTVSFADSKIPIVQNVHAKAETKAEILQKNLVSQISGSVKWTQTMQELRSLNCDTIIECGNGSVLKGLFKKSDPEFFKVYTTNSLEDLKVLETLK